MAYQTPRLRSHTVERLIEDGLAACPTEAEAVRQFYISTFGDEVGNHAFNRFRQGLREMMVQRLTAMKQQLGN